MEIKKPVRESRFFFEHGISFTDAIDVFNHPVLTAPDKRKAYGEERWIALGWMKATIAVVVYVERSGDIFRIVSARKATKHEEKRYALRNGN